MRRNAYMRNKSVHNTTLMKRIWLHNIATITTWNLHEATCGPMWVKRKVEETQVVYDNEMYLLSSPPHMEAIVNVESTSYSTTMMGLSINAKLNSLSRVMHKLKTLTMMRHLLLWQK